MKKLNKYLTHRKFCSAVLLVSLATASQLAALPMTFFGENLGVFNQNGSPTGGGFATAANAETNFLSFLTGVGTESFESYTDGSTAPLAISFVGAGTATISGGGAVDDDPSTGQNAVDGSKWWRTGAGNDFVITFSTPVSAFGFYGIDVGDINSQLNLQLVGGSTISIDIPHTLGGTSNGAVFYYGYIDPDIAIASAVFTNPAAGDDFGFDNMTIGSRQQVNVPDGGFTLGLLGMALAGMGLLRRQSA